MEFKLSETIAILERTPKVLNAYLNLLSNNWTKNNEGQDTWSPYDIIGHLIIGEKTDWMIRVKIILSNSKNKTFEPFDRFAQFKENQNTSLSDLLEKFSQLRESNLKELKSLNISEEDLALKGIHPEFGEVTLKQLLATWTVHDLGHIAQISRVMAKQYKEEVGLWINYLGILNK